MRLLLDMNLSPRWCDVFSEAGVEASHWSTLGSPGASDVEIMRYAAAEDWIVLTHDLDFGAILAATQGYKPSVVQLRGDDISPETGSGLVVGALRQCAGELGAGALLTIDLRRVRLTLLPLRMRDA
jgi:predicted nuclease of predicted toxin-antitoxin system